MNGKVALLALLLLGGCGGKEAQPGNPLPGGRGSEAQAGNPLPGGRGSEAQAGNPLPGGRGSEARAGQECKVVPRTGAGCDTEGIIATVKTQVGPKGGVANCYRTHETQRRRGKVSLTIFLAPDGKAQSVKVGSDAIGNPRLAGCLQRILAELQYPAPGDKPCTVVYPFDFR